MQLLARYVEQNQATRYNFRGIVGIEQWNTYWHKVQDAMQDAQIFAEEIRLAIHQALK